ncbi:MAG: hypothetical protein WC943_02125 [Elusimicrobiota bacterium]|jgi:hypothetical protein
MTLSPKARESLLGLVRRSLAESAARLSAISKTSWDVPSLEVSTGSAEEGLSLPAGKDGGSHYGVYFIIPGGVFLVLYPQESGAAVAHAFMSGLGSEAKALPDLEPSALGEVSNILINTVSSAIGDACGMLVFLSAPEVRKGDRTELSHSAFDRLVVREDPSVVVGRAEMASPDLPGRCSVFFALNSAMAGQLAGALEG